MTRPKGPIPADKLVATVRGLERFANDALGLQRRGGTLSGFEYTHDLLMAAMLNAHVETFSEHADSLHAAIKKAPIQQVAHAYLHRAKAIGARHDMSEHDVVLAFDYTEEDYYGKLDSPWLHAWTGERAVRGKWKFLTCSIVNRDTPLKVPILSIPTPIGYDMAKQVSMMLGLVKPLVGSIRLILFDRGFYSKDLMKTLSDLEVPYLIFVPKTEKVKKELRTMVESEKRKIRYEFEYRKDKTTHRGTTNLAILKQIFDPRAKKPFDWAFATNVDELDLDHIIQKYKGRWRIETGFRVQDKAHVASSSKNVEIRYFYFAFEQAMQFAWAALYKPATPYKSFVFQAWQTSHQRVTRATEKQTRRAGAADG